MSRYCSPVEPFFLDFEHFITNIAWLRWDVQRSGGRVSGLTRYGHAKQVMKQWMERFVERVDEAHGDNN